MSILLILCLAGAVLQIRDKEAEGFMPFFMGDK